MLLVSPSPSPSPSSLSSSLLGCLLPYPFSHVCFPLSSSLSLPPSASLWRSPWLCRCCVFARAATSRCVSSSLAPFPQTLYPSHPVAINSPHARPNQPDPPLNRTQQLILLSLSFPFSLCLFPWLSIPSLVLSLSLFIPSLSLFLASTSV